MNVHLHTGAVIELRACEYGTRPDGGAFQIYRNDDRGIQLFAEREKRRWTERWSADFISGHEYATPEQLLDAIAQVPQDKRVTPAPTVLRIDPADHRGTMRCYLCAGERGPWTHSVRVRIGWRSSDETLIASCNADLDAIKADPGAAIKERRAHVARSKDLL